MKLAPIVIAAGAVLSGAYLTLKLNPNLVGTFWAGGLQCRNKRLKKKRVRKRDGPVFVMYKDTNDQLLTDFLIPEIENQTGIKTVTVNDANKLGKRKTDCYRNLVENSSVTLVILTKDLLYDPWLKYAMAFCFQKDLTSLYLCYDDAIKIELVSNDIKNATLIGCRTMPFGSKMLTGLAGLNQFAMDISNFVLKNNDIPLMPEIKTGHENQWKYDAFCIHDLDEPVSWHTMHDVVCKEEANIYCSGDILPGKYLNQAYSEAIHSSRLVVFALTPQMLKNPYFEYQLSLALCCKGHRSVIFLLNRNCLTFVPDNPTFQYAIATCRKIFRA